MILAHHDERHRLWHALELERRLAPLLGLLEAFYGGGEPVLVCLDRLCGATTIPAHRDGPQLRRRIPHALPSFYRRTHAPLTTSAEVEFVIGGERRHLAAGEVWEINNWRVHQRREPRRRRPRAPARRLERTPSDEPARWPLSRGATRSP